MAASVGILHGWSDDSKSFAPMKAFLAGNGINATSIWLGEYVSLDDDVRVQDVVKRMHKAIAEAIGSKKLQKDFDLIVHSTGALVAREWLTQLHESGSPVPVKRLVMLAPANFGSRLATKGKSMIGRVAKGWNNRFQSGAEMLDALELASPYQWALSRRDLLDPSGKGDGPYGTDKVWPFIITGSRGYSSGLRQIINENGADGTVRVAAANLNAVGMTIDFSDDPAKPKCVSWKSRSGMEMPLAVLPERDHSTIIDPGADVGTGGDISARLGRLILAALGCETPDDYGKIQRDWREISETTAELGRGKAEMGGVFTKDPPRAHELHQYFHIVARVRDDHGQPVEDFFLEFFPPKTRSAEPAVYFHSEVLEHVHVNSKTASLRSIYVDRNDLIENFYHKERIPDPKKRKVEMSISAAALGRNIRYFDARRTGATGSLLVHSEDETTRKGIDARLFRNTTHLVEIVIPRQPIESVFTIR